MMSPCKDCKGQFLTHGRCHATCSRYKRYQSEYEKAKKDIKESSKYNYTKERYA